MDDISFGNFQSGIQSEIDNKWILVITLNCRMDIKVALIVILIMGNGPAFDSIRKAPDHVETDLEHMAVGGMRLPIVRNLSHSISYVRAGERNCTGLEIG